MESTRSRELFERGRHSVPGGTHSNSRAAEPYPSYFRRAQGAYLWDVDGNRWTDYVMGNAAVLLGHGNPAVIEAVKRALDDGLGAGVESELSVAAAEKFLQLVPRAEQVRFTNTGTEAAMHVVHLARAITGRPGIAKIEGAYHGWWDEVFVSTWPDLTRAGDKEQPASLPGGPGLSEEAIRRAVVVPFNDLDATRRVLERHRDHLAALFVEPVMIDVGFIPPQPGYLEGLRSITEELGILLVFDELLTGFRVALGGAQEKYRVTPDLSMWGKGLANGFPIAALAGLRKVMERSAPGPGNAPFVGTFNGYRPALAACLATLERLEDGSVLRRLEQRSQELSRRFDEESARAGIPAKLHCGGGHFQPYFTDAEVVDYRSAATTNASRYSVWHRTLAERGMITVPKALLHNAFGAAHSDDDLAAFVDATRAAFTVMQREER
jgi:glutamate-1-semialdehyde 2,1-aminomutase